MIAVMPLKTFNSVTMLRKIAMIPVTFEEASGQMERTSARAMKTLMKMDKESLAKRAMFKKPPPIVV